MNNLILLAKGTGFVDPVEGEGFAASWERFSGLGIQTFLLGILTVFAVLSILWGCLEIFRYLFYTIPERKKANGSGDKPVSEPAAPVAAPAAPAAAAAPASQFIDAPADAAMTEDDFDALMNIFKR